MSYVYLIGDETYQKIGVSKNPERRLKTLQTACVEHLELRYKIEVPDDKAFAVEKYLHHEYNYHRVMRGGTEWFELSPRDGVELMTYEDMMLETTLTRL